MASRSHLAVRNGRVLDIGGRSAPPRDLLIVDGEIAAAASRLVEANAGALARGLEGVVSQFCVGLAARPYPVHRWCGA